MPLPHATKRQREPETGPLRPEQVHVEPARVVLARNTGGENSHVIHVPLNRVGEIEAPPTRPGQVMRQLHDTAWRASQVTERRRQGLLDATPARGQIPLAASTVHGAIVPRIEGIIEPKHRMARPRPPARQGGDSPGRARFLPVDVRRCQDRQVAITVASGQPYAITARRRPGDPAVGRPTQGSSGSPGMALRSHYTRADNFPDLAQRRLLDEVLFLQVLQRSAVAAF